MPDGRDPNLGRVELAAQCLGPLLEELTLVGGASAGLLITDPAALQVRPTVDVDVVPLDEAVLGFSNRW